MLAGVYEHVNIHQFGDTSAILNEIQFVNILDVLIRTSANDFLVCLVISNYFITI